MSEPMLPDRRPRTPAGDWPWPSWAVISDKRADHIRRVTELIDQWSVSMALSRDEAQAWHDAAMLHDALRDADEVMLRSIVPGESRPVGMLHGFAAATKLAAHGEPRIEVLDAVRWHTIGHAGWGRTGRALYMADFLEPGRAFMRADRAFLAKLVPTAFDAVFRQVVRMRLEWTIREGKGFAAETVALWDSVR